MANAQPDPPADVLADAQVELETRIRRGQLQTVEDLQANFPTIWDDPEARLELIYSEYVLRTANGEQPRREDWFTRYPELHERLERLFGLFDLMAADTHRPAATIGPEQSKSNSLAGSDHPTGYDIIGELGRGGMSVVYRARHLELNRVVALKVLRWGDWDAADDTRIVRREAEMVARLQHPNIVQVFEVGEWDGDPFLALEYLPGGSLADALSRFQRQGQTGVSTEQAVRLIGVLANAVQAAHEQGVVHRDLKPANVLLADDPTEPFAKPKITDFGLAVSTELSPAITQTATVAGTPCYMAPEQADARRAIIGPRTDVYSLGGILYELLTGRPPFQGATVLETLDLVRHTEPTSPRQLRPNLPRDLETICLKCLAKDPTWRYESATALADDLARFQDGKPISARPVGLVEKGWKWCKRKPMLAGMAAGLLLAITLGSAGITREYLRAERERNNAVAANALTAERLKQIELINGTVFNIFEEFDLRKVKAEETPVEAELAKKLIEAGKKLNAEAIADPIVLANLRNRLGITLLSLGEAPAAIDLLAEAWELRKNQLGPNHFETLTTQGNLAEGYLAAGTPEKALPLCEDILTRSEAHLSLDATPALAAANILAQVHLQAARMDKGLQLLEETLRRSETRFGREDNRTLKAMNNLGDTYRQVGRMDDAIRLLKSASDIQKDKLGETNQDTLTTLGSLALAYDESGRRDLSLPLYERILRGEKATLGPSHPNTLVTMNNLAWAYLEDDQLDTAVNLFDETLKLEKIKHGLDHPATLTCMANLGLAYMHAKRPLEALPVLERAVALRTEKLTATHPHTLNVMNSLAACYQLAGKFDHALRLFSELHTLQVKTLGESNPDTLVTLNNWGLCHRAAGNFDQAVPIHEKVLVLQRAKAIADHPDTHWYMNVLAAAYDSTKQFSKSEALHRERLASVSKTKGRESLEYATAAAAFGQSLMVQKRAADAEPLHRECLAIREKQDPDRWTTFYARSLLGGSLLGQKKYAEAEPLLVAGYEGMKAREKSMRQSNGQESVIPEALDRLIALYTATNKPDEVKKYQALRASYPTAGKK